MVDYTDFFESKKRNNGETFFCLKDGEWHERLQNLMRRVHLDYFFDSLPCDWIYFQTYWAFDALKDCEDEETFDDLFAEIQADYSACDLMEWAKKGYAREYIDDFVKNRGIGSCIIEIVQNGQIYAIEEIYQAVWQFIKANEEPK